MTETATDAQTPDILWQRAMDRVAENDRLRTEAHEALNTLIENLPSGWFQVCCGKIRCWMERCG